MFNYQLPIKKLAAIITITLVIASSFYSVKTIHLMRKTETEVVISMDRKINAQEFDLQDAIFGQTNLRFWYGPHGFDSNLLQPNDPVTYRAGIATFTTYLRWLSACGQNKFFDDVPQGIRFDYINDSTEKMITIFSTERINNANLWAHCWGLVTLKLLGRLDDVNSSRMITNIKNKQLPDGGFPSLTDSSYSDLESTLYAVFALNAVGERPLNTSAVKSFVDRLQVGEHIQESLSYNFLPHEHTTVGVSNFETVRAGTIFRILDFPLNNSDKLLLQFNSLYSSFLANYSSLSVDDQIGGIYGLMKWSYIFPEKYAEVCATFKPLALSLHETLPDDSDWLHIPPGADRSKTRFPLIMARLGRSNPRIECHISSGGFIVTNKQQPFILRVNNTGPLWYAISTQSLTIQGAIADYLSITNFSTNNFQLNPKEYVDIPFTIENKTSASLDAFLNKTMTISLSLKAPVIATQEYYIDLEYYNCSLTFEMSLIKEPASNSDKGMNPFVILGLVSIPIITAGISIATIPKIIKRKKTIEEKDSE